MQRNTPYPLHHIIHSPVLFKTVPNMNYVIHTDVKFVNAKITTGIKQQAFK
jgi:hypothetical protein